MRESRSTLCMRSSSCRLFAAHGCLCCRAVAHGSAVLEYRPRVLIGDVLIQAATIDTARYAAACDTATDRRCSRRYAAGQAAAVGIGRRKEVRTDGGPRRLIQLLGNESHTFRYGPASPFLSQRRWNSSYMSCDTDGAHPRGWRWLIGPLVRSWVDFLTLVDPVNLALTMYSHSESNFLICLQRTSFSLPWPAGQSTVFGWHKPLSGLAEAVCDGLVGQYRLGVVRGRDCWPHTAPSDSPSVSSRWPTRYGHKTEWLGPSSAHKGPRGGGEISRHRPPARHRRSPGTENKRATADSITTAPPPAARAADRTTARSDIDRYKVTHTERFPSRGDTARGGGFWLWWGPIQRNQSVLCSRYTTSVALTVCGWAFRFIDCYVRKFR